MSCHTGKQRPVLYSFRRCPFAMRARLAILVSGEVCELREVKLANKPSELGAASPKATVPVLVDVDGTVLDQSLDIMHWALERHDPENWLAPPMGNKQQMDAVIESIDGSFKHHLDRYKYEPRYTHENDGKGVDPLEHRDAAISTLKEFEQQLKKTRFLFGDQPSLADIATAPFVRQFANVDAAWFSAQPLPRVQQWLGDFLESKLFLACMKKYTPWKSGTKGIPFPD